MKNNSFGITLIALVITIIVLLILAGVTMNLFINDGGIFEKATQAREAQKEAEVIERVQLMLADYKVEKVIDGVELIDYLNAEKSAGNLDKVTRKW